jgi:hypothetical protein
MLLAGSQDGMACVSVVPVLCPAAMYQLGRHHFVNCTTSQCSVIVEYTRVPPRARCALLAKNPRHTNRPRPSGLARAVGGTWHPRLAGNGSLVLGPGSWETTSFNHGRSVTSRLLLIGWNFCQFRADPAPESAPFHALFDMTSHCYC